MRPPHQLEASRGDTCPFLKFNIHRNQKLRCASTREVTATAVLPPSFVGEVAAMCCFKLPDACGGNL
ncbi:unnamed protein product [Brassica rapa]|uniref:Uncharacterized protein n=1 Tax=Brassica campestris TaxID=3711 RepID=A0A8D9G5N3_BRACM|nr:unnamed protein product [Brassica rapa]